MPAQDDEPFPFKCPRCFQQFFEKLGRIRAGVNVQCPECGTHLLYDPEQAVRQFEDAKKSGKDFWWG